MGGLILLESNTPSDIFESDLSVGIGNYGDLDLGAVISGPISENLSARLAMQQYKSNGFIKNDFLSKDDTNDFDEQTFRAKIKWRPSDKTQLNFTASSYDTNNGYDAFSLENIRHTDSDEPGHDRQQSKACLLYTSPSPRDS